MTYGFKNEMSNLANFHTSSRKEVMLDKSSVYVLAEGIYFCGSPSNLTFWTFHCLPEVVQFPHVIFHPISSSLKLS